MRHNLIIIGLALAAFPIYGQTQDSHRSVFQQATAVPMLQNKPVARVNGVVLTDRDLLREMYAIFPYARQHNGSFPKAMEPDIRKGALKMIEFEELVYQEAKRRGMRIGPARLDKAEKDFLQQFKSPEMFQMYLKEEAQGSRKVLRTKVERSLLIDDLLKVEVVDKAYVTPAETRTYYIQHPEKFQLPETFALQTISTTAGAKATSQQLADARKRAEEALKHAKLTKDYESFGVLAEKISEDDYRVMMGDHRAVDTESIPAQLLNALRKMQIGQISEIIQVEQYFTIVRLNARHPAGKQGFEDIKATLRNQLKQSRIEQLRAALNQKLRKTARVEEL